MDYFDKFKHVSSVVPYPLLNIHTNIEKRTSSRFPFNTVNNNTQMSNTNRSVVVDQSTQVYWHELPIPIPPWEEERHKQQMILHGEKATDYASREMISDFAQGILSVASLLSTTNESMLKQSVASSPLLSQLFNLPSNNSNDNNNFLGPWGNNNNNNNNNNNQGTQVDLNSFNLIDPVGATRKKAEKKKAENELFQKKVVLAQSLTPLLAFNTCLCYLGAKQTVSRVEFELACMKVLSDLENDYQQHQQQQREENNKNSGKQSFTNTQMTSSQQTTTTDDGVGSGTQPMTQTKVERIQKNLHIIEPTLFTCFKNILQAEKNVRTTAPIRCVDGSLIHPVLQFQRVTPDMLPDKVLTVRNYFGVGERVLFSFDPVDPSQFVVCFGVEYSSKQHQHRQSRMMSGGHVMILSPIRDPMCYVMRKKRFKPFSKETFMVELVKMIPKDGMMSASGQQIASSLSMSIASPSRARSSAPTSPSNNKAKGRKAKRRQRSDNDDDEDNYDEEDNYDSSSSESSSDEEDERKMMRFSDYLEHDYDNDDENNLRQSSTSLESAYSGSSTFYSVQQIQNNIATTKPLVKFECEKALSQYLRTKFNVISFIKTRGSSFFEDTGISPKDAMFPSSSSNAIVSPALSSSSASSASASSSVLNFMKGGATNEIMSTSSVALMLNEHQQQQQKRAGGKKQKNTSSSSLAPSSASVASSSVQSSSILSATRSPFLQSSAGNYYAGGKNNNLHFSPVGMLAQSAAPPEGDDSTDVIRRYLPKSPSLIHRGGFHGIAANAKDRWYYRIMYESGRSKLRRKYRERIVRMQHLQKQQQQQGGGDGGGGGNGFFNNINNSQEHDDDEDEGYGQQHDYMMMNNNHQNNNNNMMMMMPQQNAPPTLQNYNQNLNHSQMAFPNASSSADGNDDDFESFRGGGTQETMLMSNTTAETSQRSTNANIGGGRWSQLSNQHTFNLQNNQEQGMMMMMDDQNQHMNNNNDNTSNNNQGQFFDEDGDEW